MLGSMLIEHEGVPTLLLLSGGSSISFLNDVPVNSLSSHITVTTLDERYSDVLDENNFLQIKKTDFYEDAVLRGARFIESVPLRDESLEQFAMRQGSAIRKWVEEHPTGYVIATVGFGEDGHLAGIFPMAKERFDATYGEEVVVPVTLDGNMNEHSERISVTPWFLTTHIHDAVTFALGEKKYALLKEIAEKGNVHERPMRLLARMSRVEAFSDYIEES